MSTELYIPPQYAKLDSRSPFYTATETFKRRSEASRKTMAKYWSDGRHRKRVDRKQAKPVDVFDLEGHYLQSFPSSRKAAIALFPETDYHSAERVIRNARQGVKNKQYRGYMFRDSTDNPTDIEPYTTNPRRSGYHVTRGKNTYFTKPVVAMYLGVELRFDSIKECAEQCGISKGGIWIAMKQGRPIKGYTIKFKSHET